MDSQIVVEAQELQKLLDTANAPIFGVDVNGNINEWNFKTGEITGYSRQEAIGKSLVSTLIIPRLRRGVQNILDKALRGFETSCYQLELLTKSNETRHLLINFTSRKNIENKIVGVVGIAQDITAVVEKERGISSNTCDLCQTIDSTNCLIFGLDLNGNIIEYNKKIALRTGFSREEVIGKPFIQNFIEEPMQSSVQVILEKSFKGKETVNHELEIRTKRNATLYLLACVSPRLDVHQNITGAVVTAIINTGTKDKKAIVITTEHRKSIETANAPIFGVNMNGYVNEWNSKIAEVTGYTKDEAMSKPVGTFIPPKVLSNFEQAVDDARQGKETRKCELQLKTKSNEIRHFFIKTKARLDTKSNIIGTVSVAQDVTEAAEHDRKLRSMWNELRQLVDTMPLFGVDTFGYVNEWNDKTAEITGWQREEALNKNLIETFIAPKLHDSVHEVLYKALHGHETSNYELEFRTKSNEIRYLLVNVTTRRAPEGNIVGVVGVAQDVTESSKNDRAIAAMAHGLRQLIDTANAPIFGIDVKGNVNEWNNMTVEITGFSKEEAFNKPLVTTFIVPSLRKSVQEVLDKALHGDETSNYELEFETKLKEIRYLLVNATTRRDAEHNIVGVVGVAQDVTETTKNDHNMRAVARELRQLVDTANAPIFGIDMYGNVNEWNDKTAEITGFSKEEAFDYPLVETFIVPSLRQSVQEVMDNALEGLETSNYELEFRTKSNEVRYLLVNATTRRDTENNIVGVVGVAQDVTEAARHDRAVAALASELRQLVDTANAPIFGIDIHGNVNEWNNKTAEITGFLKEEAMEKPLVSTFIVPSLRQSVQVVLDEALRGNETSNYELEFETKSKEIRYLLVNATTRRDVENNVVGVVGVAQDVTDDRKHSQELREMQYIRAAQEAKVETERNMTAYFAHELRNPLHAIDSALNAMPDGLSDSAQSLVDSMQLCTSFMSSIMNNLLDVRKMEEGKMKLNSIPISIISVLDNVYKMLQPSVRPNVDFLTDLKIGEKIWVLGDSHRIQQVMTNVVTNAIKYTTSGYIKLILEWEGEYLRFECADTGPGIPIKVQKKLFERFVQRGGAPGTGLGLAIAKHLVDLNGGSIGFESDPTQKPGTSCVVKMPMAVCEPPDDVNCEDNDSPLEEPISILIIDDVAMNRSMLRRRITRGIAPNAIITEACSGEEALVIVGNEEFDVIIVDQYMEESGGVMVGTDVVFAMRRMKLDSIIIGCSGNDINNLFTEAGSDWVWGKPVPPNKIILKQLKSALVNRKIKKRELEDKKSLEADSNDGNGASEEANKDMQI